MKRGITLLFSLLMFATPAFADHSININTADKDTLMALTGIGEVKAQAIIDYRNANGSFQNKEDIMNVNGVGAATYNNIKDHIVLEGGSSPVSPSPSQSPAPPPSSSPSPVTVSSTELSVEAGGDRTIIVNADVQFMARAYSGKTVMENTAFTWNFGDGSTGQGAYVTHRFEYAGNYAVVIIGSKGGASASDRFTVTAEAARLAVRVLSDGSVEIENRATREADLSGWIIQSGGQRFALPENTAVLAGQIMRISPNTLHFFASESTELAYPSGTTAFKAERSETSVAPTTPPQTPLADTEVSQEVPDTAPVKVVSRREVPEPVAEADENAPVEERATSSQVAAVSESARSAWGWWLGAAGIAGAAAAAIIVARRFGRNEWNIIEDTAE